MGMDNKQTISAKETLKELMLGTVLCGILLVMLTVWFADSKLRFAASMATGILGAVAMAAHMYRSIEYAMEMPEESAGKYMRKQSMLRMLGAMALVLAAYWLGGNIIAIFLGLLTLKPGAYVQPLLHRFLSQKLKKGR